MRLDVLLLIVSCLFTTTLMIWIALDPVSLAGALGYAF